MDLTTSYMGLELATPFVAGASPLSDSVDAVCRAVEAGASAVVMHSLFEEQIRLEQLAMYNYTTSHANSYGEALSYFPEARTFSLGPDEYLAQLTRLKAAVNVPVIASLNGVTPGGWMRYARRMEEAGADGLELNVYYLAFDPDESPMEVEQRYVDVLSVVKRQVSIPLAMKLSPFHSAPLYTARRLERAGAAAVVLFNRFYQPDIDIEKLDVISALELSNSSELLLRLRWLAAMFGNVELSLAASGGVHTGHDAIKALMAGANIVQMTSALLRNGPGYVSQVKDELVTWMQAHEYESVKQMQGSMSLKRCPSPAAFERANYAKILQRWHEGA